MMKIKMNNKKVFLILFLSVLVFPMFVLGALENTYPALPNSPAPGVGGVDFFVYAFNLAVIVAAVVAISVIIYSGVTIMLSSGNMAKITDAQDRIKGAIFGTFLLLASYILITTINPELKKFEIQKVSSIPGQIIENITPKPTNTTVTYEELPIGSIIESILSPVSTTLEQKYNYSQLVGAEGKKAGEEQCYLYTAEGNTIDRNSDGLINDQDMFEGLDLSICMNELLKATEQKIKDANGGKIVCTAESANSPIDKLKNLMSKGCSCSSCQTFTDTMQHECQSSCCGTGSGGCSCCGGPRGSDSGCPRTFSGYAGLNSPFAAKSVALDPCKNRGAIDCQRQEFTYRTSGVGLGLGLHGCGYAADLDKFVDSGGTLNPIELVKKEKSAFLTLSEAKTRINSFKIYFEKRLSDLNAAEAATKDKTKNVLSLAEFQALKESNKDEIKVTQIKQSATNPDYNIIGYHSNFNCINHNQNKATNLCNKGELVKTQSDNLSRFYPGEPDAEYPNDHLSAIWPIRQKRTWGDASSKLPNSGAGINLDGDAATFYVLKDAGPKTNGQYSTAAQAGILDYNATSTKCSLNTSTNKETMASLITIGQLTDRAENYAGQLIGIINKTITETDSAINALDRIAQSPEQCACSSGCKNSCISESCGEDSDCGSYQAGCTSCKPNSQVVCSCCGECIVKGSDGPLVSVEQDWADPANPCKGELTLVEDGVYSSNCPCSGSSNLVTDSVGSNPNASDHGALSFYNGKTYDVTIQEDGKPVKATLPDYEQLSLSAPFLNYYNITECKMSSAGTEYKYTLEKDKEYKFSWWKATEPYYWKWKSTFKVELNTATNNAKYNCSGAIDKTLIATWYSSGVTASPDDTSHPEIVWINGNTFDIVGIRINRCAGFWAGSDSPSNYLKNPPRTYSTACSEVHTTSYGLATRVVISRTPLDVIKNGQKNDSASYICPINKVSEDQCQIYKRIEGVGLSSIENIVNQQNFLGAQTCFEQPGFLQRIELWQKRLWDFQYYNNPKTEDENRWTLLDMLTTARTRLNSCIQGYGAPYKEDLAKEILFTCQEGITANRLGTFAVIPDFPYPVSNSQKNCYPLNSLSLSAGDKQKCAANMENKTCQDIIKNYMDDYYCCSQGN